MADVDLVDSVAKHLGSHARESALHGKRPRQSDVVVAAVLVALSVVLIACLITRILNRTAPGELDAGRAADRKEGAWLMGPDRALELHTPDPSRARPLNHASIL